MATELATAYVSIVPDTRQLARDLTGSPMQALGNASGASAGAGFAASLTTAAVAAAAAAAAASAAAFKAAFDLGSTFDDSFDYIRVGTGATGSALESLKDDFRAVAASTPAELRQVSMAVADLNTRLGLTGQPLRDISEQFINLSRITGTDLATSIANGTRVFGDWGVAVEDQAGALDAIFRAAQASGVQIDKLQTSLVQYGAPLRQMGFDFETATAMLSKFDKEGVNTELVIGSMRIALGKMAREGIADPAEGFKELTSRIKDAGTEGEATAIAMEYFGARAGADMAAAVREGRFELDDMIAAISNTSETISTAAGDTADFAESWQLVKNNLGLLLEGPATGLFTWVSDIAGSLADFTQGLRSGGGILPPWLTAQIATFKDALGDLNTTVMPTIREWYSEYIEPAVTSIKEAFGSIAEEVVPTLTAVVDFVRDNWPAIQKVIEPVMSAISGTIQGVMNVIAGVIRTVMAVIRGDWGTAWEGVETAFSGIVDIIKNTPIGQFITEAFDVVKKVGPWFEEMRDKVVSVIRNLLERLRNPMASIKELLEILNPFKRHSPSLVDNVLRGVGVIRDAYSGLSGMEVAGPRIGGIAAGVPAYAAAMMPGGSGAQTFNITGSRSDAVFLESAVRRVLSDSWRPGL